MNEPGDPAESAVPVIEIRTFRLVPGGKKAFDRVAHRVLPMLQRYGIRVVACEPSADPDDHYVLIRAFSSAAERDEQLGAFYGSDEWHQNYRDSVLDLIDSYHIVAIELTAYLAESYPSWPRSRSHRAAPRTLCRPHDRLNEYALLPRERDLERLPRAGPRGSRGRPGQRRRLRAAAPRKVHGHRGCSPLLPLGGGVARDSGLATGVLAHVEAARDDQEFSGAEPGQRKAPRSCSSSRRGPQKRVGVRGKPADLRPLRTAAGQAVAVCPQRLPVGPPLLQPEYLTALCHEAPPRIDHETRIDPARR
jgi:hypothetical protein